MKLCLSLSDIAENTLICIINEKMWLRVCMCDFMKMRFCDSLWLWNGQKCSVYIYDSTSMMYMFISSLGTTCHIQKPKLIKKYDMCCENVHMVKVRFCDWLVLWDELWCSVYGSNSPRTLNTCLSLSDESMSTIGCELTKKFDLCFKSVMWWKCDFAIDWCCEMRCNAPCMVLTRLER